MLLSDLHSFYYLLSFECPKLKLIYIYIYTRYFLDKNQILYFLMRDIQTISQTAYIWFFSLSIRNGTTHQTITERNTRFINSTIRNTNSEFSRICFIFLQISDTFIMTIIDTFYSYFMCGFLASKCRRLGACILCIISSWRTIVNWR